MVAGNFEGQATSFPRQATAMPSIRKGKDAYSRAAHTSTHATNAARFIHTPVIHAPRTEPRATKGSIGCKTAPTIEEKEEEVTTPVKAGNLARMLGSYEDKDYLIMGFTEGFRIGYSGNDSSVFATNSKSLLENPEEARKKIDMEISMNRIKGPFSHPPFRNFKACPLALRVKPNGKYRLLHNLSYPYNSDSVNLCIAPENYEVEYASVQDAADVLLTMPGAYMGKLDIAEAFRIIPIHKEDHHLLGFTFEGKYYYDTCLPMGCSSSCQIFQRFSDALVSLLKTNYGVSNVIKYLDDFLIIAKDSSKCQAAMDSFLSLCQEAGIPIASQKTEGPTTSLTFLGYGLDSVKMVISIPIEKIKAYRDTIHSLLMQKNTTLRELKSLIGKLLFVTNVVTSGRIFLRRLINLTIGKKHPATRINITDGLRDDLIIWLQFFKQFNGKAIIEEKKFTSSNSLHMFTDSCKQGFGGCFRNKFIEGKFPESWQGFDIQFLELYPIYLLLAMFASSLQHKQVMFHSDNRPIVDMLNAQTAKNVRTMELLRRMILIMLNFDISFKAKHIPGAKNILCDAISRSQASRRMLLEHGMETRPTKIPEAIQPRNYKT